MTKTKICVGDKVVIKKGWLKGNWGTVKMIDDDWYHVAMFNGNDCMVFARDEIRKE